MIWWINMLTGRRWWYSILVEYKGTDGRVLVSGRCQFGCMRRSEILSPRQMKKNLACWFFDDMPKRLLCNGTFTVHVAAYLGWIRKESEISGVRLCVDELVSKWVITSMMAHSLPSREARARG